jgi:hypothetical protein
MHDHYPTALLADQRRAGLMAEAQHHHLVRAARRSRSARRGFAETIHPLRPLHWLGRHLGVVTPAPSPDAAAHSRGIAAEAIHPA